MNININLKLKTWNHKTMITPLILTIKYQLIVC